MIWTHRLLTIDWVPGFVFANVPLVAVMARYLPLAISVKIVIFMTHIASLFQVLVDQ
tara:strand:- start:240 stop:410 length:171 start_codon:yes stop_codon:yes gene_type:complete